MISRVAKAQATWLQPSNIDPFQSWFLLLLLLGIVYVILPFRWRIVLLFQPEVTHRKRVAWQDAEVHFAQIFSFLYFDDLIGDASKPEGIAW